ncbi:MAG: GH92 family glycosyl hydrolase [Candidatus Pseudobacter hemicellulosilyticus]|uniref:GH92 family glycosyl hydrolase n=1 Tax=Candidatus Pseudobacter hemicellulosilyticus TaxID=3121375 RepID=A0AAJ5WUK9_9BACT|nr:MAG: GH92 family glycosyl hydrolase [Pseudobacter sp.]
MLLGFTQVSAQDQLPEWAMGPFIRPAGVNPVLAPLAKSTFKDPMSGKQVAWESNDVFNPAAAVRNGKIYVLYRAEDKSGVGIGQRTSRLGIAESRDGIVMKRSPHPVFYPSNDNQKEFEWPGGCEDPRIAVTEDGTYVMLYTQWNKKVARLAVAHSRDLKTWTKHGPAFYKAYNGKFADLFSKSASIVTKLVNGRQVIARVNGKYMMYWGERFMNIATSDDLKNWEPMLDDKGKLKLLITPRPHYFDSDFTECGPPAVITDKGIVVLYNGKNKAGKAGDPNYTANTYAAGQVLFDLNDPTKVISRLDKPFFVPTESFEKSGQYPAGTVFVEGLVYHQKKWFLYYGCADSRVGVAVYDPAADNKIGVISSTTDYAAKVNTLIGNKGKGVSETELQFEAGFTDPGAAYPFGMVQFTPTFFAPQKGFVVNQLSGAGCPNMGNFPCLPVMGELQQSPDAMDHLNKQLKPVTANAGYYRVQLDNNIDARLTVTKRTGMARYNFPTGNSGTIVIGSGINANKMTDAHVRITGPNSCEGYADGGSFCGSPTPYKIYFVASFDQKAVSSGTWSGQQLNKAADTASGANSGAYFTFDLSAGRTVQYKFGISYVSLANARENLAKENPGFDFDQVVAGTKAAWNSYLGKIEAGGGSEDRTIQFYTHLYHALIHPSIYSDVNGEYVGSDHKVYKAKGFDYYTMLSNWDTYRTQIQLLSILAPKETSDIITSHLLFAERSGGSFPRWVLAHFETGIMQGDPSAIMVANAYAFGVKDFDTRKALAIMRRGAEVPGARSQTIETRPDLAQYLEKGYMNASMQLEYTSADFAIGRFALDALNDQSLYRQYLKRAQSWKNLYNPATTWLNSRNPDGSWKNYNDDWREATYNSYFWMIPYNLKSLIDTIGGKKAAEKRLDTLFRKLNATYYEEWFAAGNEPDFQAPWSYNWAGAPYKTQALVKRIIAEQYSNRDNGLPGNDDLGAMGAWYVFANMGLFPMIPGYGGFSLNSPGFPEIKIHLPKGTLRITGGSEGKPYIQSLQVNGTAFNSTWLPWETISKGGKLDFQLGDQPNTSWGTAAEPPSFE